MKSKLIFTFSILLVYLFLNFISLFICLLFLLIYLFIFSDIFQIFGIFIGRQSHQEAKMLENMHILEHTASTSPR